jgi:hypothetical protein
MEPARAPTTPNSVFETRTIFWIRALACAANAASAQNVDIPDSGLSAALRDALQKPTGPLAEQDMLNPTNPAGTSEEIFLSEMQSAL